VSWVGGRTLCRVEWLLAALVAFAALLILRRADLATPYWWDAAAVYVPGSRWVAENDFAAFPGVFPSLLARGHTTLFYVITALFFRAFGSAPVVGHAVVLGFSVLGLVYTYALGTWLFGRLAGVAAAVLLVISPLWLTMSSQMLPEIPLAALTVASLYAFARGRHVEATVWGVLVVLTKETGIAGPLALTGALMLWGWKARTTREVARPLVLSLVPSVVLLAFFVWQRVAEGWWVLPYHAELFEAEHSILGQGLVVLHSLVSADGRGIALALGLVMGVWRWRTAHAWPPDPRRLDPKAPPRWVVVAALVLLSLANLGFFAKMFFLERYALTVHPGVCVLLAGGLVPYARSFDGLRKVRVAAWAGALAILGTVGVALASQYAGEGYDSGEITFRYLHAIEAHQRVYAELEAREEPPVVLTEWPMTSELREPHLGFVSRPYVALSTTGYEQHESERPVELVIIQRGLGDEEELREIAWELGFAKRELRVGGCVMEVWE